VLDDNRLRITVTSVPRKECRQSFRGVSFEGKGAPEGFEKAFGKWKVSTSAWTQMDGSWLWFTCATTGSKDYLFMVNGGDDRSFGGPASAQPLTKMLDVLSEVLAR
jgi:hypothetical protein